MLFQVQGETWLGNQEIKGKILCDRVFPEETVNRTPKLLFYSGPMGHSEVDFDFAVHSKPVE